MEGSAAPPQRVCPKCARISWATGPECPYCRAKFRRTGQVTPAMLALAVAAVLVGFAALLVVGGAILDRRVDDRIEEVNRDFDRTLDRFRDDVRQELQGSGVVPPVTTPVPSVTPAPTETVTPVPTESITPSPTVTETPTTEASPSATETPFEEIRP